MIGLVIGVYLVVFQRTNIFSKADISTSPQDVKISNISDNAFTVSWITQKPTIGFVQYGESENLDGQAADDRDQGAQKARITHHVTLKKLTPATTYSYKINNGTTAKQATAPVTADPPAVPEPIFGKIIKTDGKVPQEALVYLENGNGSLLSNYTKDDGNYLITLNNARTKDSTKYITVKSTDSVTVSVNAGQDGAASAQAKISEREVFSKINLINLQTPESNKVASGVQDFNGDGVINVFDYIFYIKQQL